MIQRPAQDRGAIIPLTALLLSVIILSVAFAVDLGKQRAERRDMQAIADVVSLDLARAIQGRDAATIDGDPAWTATVLRSSARNDHPSPAIPCPAGDIVDRCVTATLGNVSDPATQTFVPCPPVGDPARSTCFPDAVEVVAGTDVEYSFQPGSGDTRRSAVASETAIAGFQVGSRLASISPAQNTILGRVFQQALGGSPALTAIGYGGLLNTTIPLRRLATQLGFGSPDELFDASVVNARDFYFAAARVMEGPPSNNVAAASVLDAMSANTDASSTVDMGQLGRVEQGGSSAAANASVDLYSLITGSVFAINGTNTISVPGLTVGTPNTSTTLSLTVIERPRFVFGREGVSVSTAQATLGLDTQLSNVPIGLPPLTGVTVSGNVRYSVGLAGATGTLDTIDCDSTPGIIVGLSPQPLTVQSSVNLTVSANILFSNVVVATATVPLTSPVAVGGTSTGATFEYPNEFLPTVGTGDPKPSPTGSLSLTGPSLGGQVVLVGSVPLGLGTVTSTLESSIIAPIGVGTSNLITNQLNRLLGLDIGGSDIGALDMSCDAVKLVG